MASGLVKKSITKTGTPAYKKFALMIHEVMGELAKLIVLDGEGATKFITVTVRNAKSLSDARKAAFRVANSNLFKTACFGGDYNWGRIMAALGNSGAYFSQDRVDILINDIPGVTHGQQDKKYMHKLKNAFKKRNIDININLNSGKRYCEILTCDLSYDYVKINASYAS
jgi:glutamate N-acetyltransferase/amino-acid N-acetyltransferase